MRRTAQQPPELPGYEPLGLLGSGGFADVFLYEQKLPRRKVAVKVLLGDDLSREVRSQFVAEANLMAQLSAHPYIVTIFHADVAADGRPYFVMEYCSGPSLSERYKRERFRVEDALRTGIRLAGAIGTAHAAGILHRDIKPANVLTNDYGWPALTDFGISSGFDGELPVHTMTVRPGESSGTGQSAVGMSVPWSPPEMFEDDPHPDARSDVFSLAATVHTLLAGRSPFEIPGRSNGALDLMGRIERGAITPIERPEVPASLVAALKRGMAVRPGDRYASAVEFGRALQRVELELGYASTQIDVPSLVESTPADAPDSGGDDPDATRARSVRTVVAQPAAPAVVLPPQIAPRVPQVPAPPVSDQTVVRDAGGAAPRIAPLAAPVDDGTVVRGGPAAAPADHTVMRQRPAAGAAEDETDRLDRIEAPRRRLGLIVSAAAVLALAVVVSAVLVIGGLPGGEEPAPTASDPQNAVVAASVPQPVVEPGVRSADGTSATFAVSHANGEEGDRYVWRPADGSGAATVAEGPEITVDGLDPSLRTCIDVAVQRAGKTSESVTGCTG
ncbi:serine/threonine-protein kinase [Agromyces archimandritae]|uniref:non-specific serine/threonine protein kinase n=1 Tax=Agromyces archimandritae TaxID=2781962 RepID=A0A975FMW6_9MICO|nr:serine/threonine-protein kinase [Agromyces archimandritae]QTX04438.1 protein kinase [Agromyces archimandritae]